MTTGSQVAPGADGGVQAPAGEGFTRAAAGPCPSQVTGPCGRPTRSSGVNDSVVTVRQRKELGSALVISLFLPSAAGGISLKTNHITLSS